MIPYFSIKEIELKQTKRRLDNVFFDSTNSVDEGSKFISFFFDVVFIHSGETDTYKEYDKSMALALLKGYLKNGGLEDLDEEEAKISLEDGISYLFSAYLNIQKSDIRKTLDGITKESDLKDFEAEEYFCRLLFGEPDHEEAQYGTIYSSWQFSFDEDCYLELLITDSMPSSRDDTEYLDKLSEALE